MLEKKRLQNRTSLLKPKRAKQRIKPEEKNIISSAK
jgi:hypothetical protein